MRNCRKKIFFLIILTAFIFSPAQLAAEKQGETTSSQNLTATSSSSRECEHLTKFTAAPSHADDSITIKWETATEADTFGFHIWRGESEYGVYARITDDMLHPRGGYDTGASYAYEDDHIEAARTYYYKLQEIQTDQDEQFYGPIATNDSVTWEDACDSGDDDDDDDDHDNDDNHHHDDDTDIYVHCFILTSAH